MRRLEFLAVVGGAATWPLGAHGQERPKIRRVGWISGLSRPPAIEATFSRDFLKGWGELGYVEGRDYLIDWRFADGKYERYAEIAAELVDQKVDVIVKLGTASAVRPVQEVTKSIPIVLGYSTDPVGNGFVKSLGRPGGNITGLASSADDTAPKQLELLASLVPGLTKVAVLVNPDNPNKVVSGRTEAAARNLGAVVTIKLVRTRQEIETVFDTFKEENVGAILVVPDALINTNREFVAGLAIKNGLPSVSGQLQYVEAGALIGYGESLREFFRRAATFVDKIFKGYRPGELPIEQPTKFFLAINMKTARAIGLEVPATFLARVDQVIE